jgi:hypothetical protein
LKRIALLIVLAAACRTVAVPDTASTGGSTPRSAVERYVAGARAQDIQAIGAIYGNDKGPRREQDPRALLERQLLIQLHCLRHEKSTISEPARGEGGRQVFTVGLTQGKLEASVPFTVVKGPSSRWYVEGFDIVALQNKGFCDKSGG